MCAKSTEYPQGRAAPRPPPAGGNKTWRGPAFSFIDCPQVRAAPSLPPAGGKKTWGGPAFSCERGFTLIELVGILIIVGVLAATALPKFGDIQVFAQTGSRDQLVAALRHAAHTAVSHRRLVCATVASNGLSLNIAAANPATACSAPLDGPTGGPAAPMAAGVTATQSPAGTLYFQPSGRITNDAAGSTAGSWGIGITGESAITISGETAYIQ